MPVLDPGPVSPRFLDQDDRIAIADGCPPAWRMKDVAAAIDKSFQTGGMRTLVDLCREPPKMMGSIRPTRESL